MKVSKRMNCLLNDLIDLRAGLSTKKDDLPEMIQKRAKKKVRRGIRNFQGLFGKVAVWTGQHRKSSKEEEGWVRQ